jgi:hypothetical protein
MNTGRIYSRIFIAAGKRGGAEAFAYTNGYARFGEWKNDHFMES